MKMLLLAATGVAVLIAANPAPAMADATKPVSQVVQWNRTLLVVVRTPGAQPATVHPTRSFAIMHAAIYDAVNAIDGTHKPYLVRLSASHFASQEAAAAAAAHEVLVKLTRASRRHSMPNFSRHWHSFRMEDRLTASTSEERWPTGYWLCGPMMARMPSPSPMFLAVLREITNRHRRISRTSPNSRIGLALHPLPWRPPTSFVPAVHQS